MAARQTSLGLLLSLPDPLLSFKWVCSYLPYDHPVHYVEAIDLPFNNIDIGDKSHVAASYLYYPGTHNISAFSMTFYEDRHAKSLKFLNTWKNDIKDFKTGLYMLPGADNESGFKKSITVQLLDSANNPVVTAKLLGVWPSDTGNLGLNYTDANRLTITQTFSIDDEELTFHY